jgi:hypothetical protein
MMKSQKKRATYRDLGKLKLRSGATLQWDPLELPFGSEVEIIVQYEDADYLRGLNGVVWATHDLEQIETIKSALEAQGITSEIDRRDLEGTILYVLRISDASRIEAAVDFIWRSEEGLKLVPDWHFPAGSGNQSFDKWTNEK